MGRILGIFLLMVSLAMPGAALANTVEFYHNKGVELLKRGQLDQAVANFTKALEKNPKSGKTYAIRGTIYLEQGLVDLAMRDSAIAIKLDPRLALAYNTQAICYYRKGNFDKAWDNVHKARSLGYKVDDKFLRVLRQASGRQY
jgi:Flp pilus assembly protein TadD